MRYAIAVAAFVFAVPLHAQNLLVNGGFETGDLTGWTFSTSSTPDCVTGYGVTGPAALMGNFGLTGGLPAQGCTGTPNVMFTQTIATTPGVTYIISGLWQMTVGLPIEACNPFHCGSAFNVQFLPPGAPSNPSSNAPTTVINRPNDFDGGVIGVRPFSREVVATSASTELRMFFWTEKNYQNVDALSVTMTPEPSTYALMALGLAALAVARRRTA